MTGISDVGFTLLRLGRDLFSVEGQRNFNRIGLAVLLLIDHHIGDQRLANLIGMAEDWSSMTLVLGP